MPNWLTEQWLRPENYNFWSSSYGESIKDLIFLFVVGYLIKRLHDKIHHHLECEVPGCNALGYRVEGTSHRACRPHHPHLCDSGHSVEEIAHAAEHGHNGRPFTERS